MNHSALHPAAPRTPSTKPVILLADEFVVWDIETCPFPVEAMSAAQMRRLDTQLRIHRERDPELDEITLVRKACSLHPELSFVCCISAVRASKGGAIHEPRSWIAASPEEEHDLLQGFLTAASRFAPGTQWVTFNGKNFDIPFVKARVAHHHLCGLVPRNGIFHDYPYRHEPHADLCGLWKMPCTLEGLCALLGVESSKAGMTGADVAQAVLDGRMDDVRDYCEADVIATAKCMQATAELLTV